METVFLRSTESICPVCLSVVDGEILSINGTVYLRKTCSQHGIMEFKIWPNLDHFQWMESFRTPTADPEKTTSALSECPRDCGLCSRHMRKSTLIEIEVTQRCNLRCPVCFMAAGEAPLDPCLANLASVYKSILDQAGPGVGIQLTGGEPTVRSDLPDIVRLGRSMGFSAVEINTNGLAISRKPYLLDELVDAGITGIYLQFDGMIPEVYRHIRGADLLAEKLLAVERCRKARIQAVLAMTVIEGVNDREIGMVLDFALHNRDVVAGIALQPVFRSGRFEADPCRSLTMGDVIFLLAEQSRGLIDPYDLWPLGCSHPLCSSGTYLAREGEGLYPITRRISKQEYVDGYDADSPQGSIFADLLAERGGFTGDGLSIVVMNYMDAWNMDLVRLRECSMTVRTGDGRTIPFCAYHLTDIHGKRLYTPREHSRAETFGTGPATFLAGRDMYGR